MQEIIHKSSKPTPFLKLLKTFYLRPISQPQVLKRLTIGPRLTLTFFLLAALAVASVGYLSYQSGHDALEEKAFEELTAVREMKADQIEEYFQLIENQLLTMATDPNMPVICKAFNIGVRSLEASISAAQFDQLKKEVWKYYDEVYLPLLNKSLPKPADPAEHYPNSPIGVLLQYQYIENNPNEFGKKHLLDRPVGDTSYYANVHEIYHPMFRRFAEIYGYDDVFLVDAHDGRVLYSCYKEVDFGTNISKGIYSKTNLGDVFRNCQENKDRDYSCIVDFAPYFPSYNKPAGFIARNVFDGDKVVAVLIFQLPIKKINAIMTSNYSWKDVGLGESGETYIVGQDFTLRNQSRFLVEDSTNYFLTLKERGIANDVLDKIRFYQSSISLQMVRTVGTEAALKGKTGQQMYDDYRGVKVLGSYKPLMIPGLQWVIMSEIDEEEAFKSSEHLKWLIVKIFIGIMIAILLASFIVARQITRPIKKLTFDSKQLAAGNLDIKIRHSGKDEIGVLANSFREMQQSILSHVHNLEDKVQERTKELQEQKEIVEEKNREIIDSINYARRLQGAVMPTIERIQSNLSQSFILYRPKDIVSGDFYWMEFKDNILFLAAVDCTGHGVPGAMVSMVGANNLNRCIKEFNLKRPADILEKLTDLVIDTFAGSEQQVKDGMDISFIALNVETKQLQYCGAHNDLWIIRNGATDIIEVDADKQPIGNYDYRKPFTNHEFQLEPGDNFYLFTDGYADQFGGPQGKKFKYRAMKELFIQISSQSMAEQKFELESRFENWRGGQEQIDDVCVIGVRV